MGWLLARYRCNHRRPWWRDRTCRPRSCSARSKFHPHRVFRPGRQRGRRPRHCCKARGFHRSPHRADRSPQRSPRPRHWRMGWLLARYRCNHRRPWWRDRTCRPRSCSARSKFHPHRVFRPGRQRGRRPRHCCKARGFHRSPHRADRSPQRSPRPRHWRMGWLLARYRCNHRRPWWRDRTCRPRSCSARSKFHPHRVFRPGRQRGRRPRHCCKARGFHRSPHRADRSPQRSPRPRHWRMGWLLARYRCNHRRPWWRDRTCRPRSCSARSKFHPHRVFRPGRQRGRRPRHCCKARGFHSYRQRAVPLAPWLRCRLKPLFHMGLSCSRHNCRCRAGLCRAGNFHHARPLPDRSNYRLGEVNHQAPRTG